MVDRKRRNAPESIGRFQIRKTLGHGAQGVVYLAFDPQLEREVAIKTMVEHLAARGTPEELLKEARTAAALRHPNIVQVYDCGQSDGIPYVVFEYVNGVSLKEVLSSAGVMAPDHAMGILVPVLEAVHYAHENGVVHRDLKPANVLIDAEGVPRITDFGIAGLLGRKASGDMTGSAGYMPPEQLEARPLQRELDIFAVGVVLYEMVAGRLPIQASNTLEQLFRMAHDEIPPPSQFNAELSSAVDTVVMKAMEREPSRRYADAKEFLTALNHFLQNDSGGGSGAVGVASANGGSGTLDFLIRRMSHKPDFPAMSQHVAEINRMAADGGDWSANALANVVLNDYSLTTKLLRLVNSPLFGQYGREIGTVSRAIVVLGFKQVRLAALSLLLFEHLQGGDEADVLREAAVGSLMSGIMAHRLAGKMTLDEPEEAFVCAMFHGLGRHLAIYYFPEEHHVVCDRMQRRGEDENTAARAVLGVTYAELGTGVARYWGFPPALTESMESLPKGKLPRPGTREAKLHQLAGFSNELCQAFSALDGEKRAAALQTTRERFAEAVTLDEASIESLVEGALEDIREHARALRLPTGGSALLERVQEWQRQQRNEPEPPQPEAANGANEPMSGTFVDPTTVLLSGVQEVTNAMLEDCPINELLSMVLEVLYRGLQPTRVLFCVMDPKKRQMAARFGFGKDVDQLLGRFSFDVGVGNDAFNVALRSGEDIAIADTRDAGAEPPVPKWLEELLPTRTLLLYPLIVQNNPLGLILLDWEVPNRTLPVELDRLVKTLRNQAVLGVRQRGR